MSSQTSTFTDQHIYLFRMPGHSEGAGVSIIITLADCQHLQNAVTSPRSSMSILVTTLASCLSILWLTLPDPHIFMAPQTPINAAAPTAPAMEI